MARMTLRLPDELDKAADECAKLEFMNKTAFVIQAVRHEVERVRAAKKKAQ